MPAISLQTALLDPSGPDVTAGQIMARWRKRAQLTGRDPAYEWSLVEQIAAELVVVTVEFGLRTSIIAAQIEHETGNFTFTGQVQPGQFNFAGLGATNGGAVGASFAKIRWGLEAVCAHHLVYIYGIAANWPGVLRVYHLVDPRYQAVLDTGRAGQVAVLGDYTNGNWAWTPGIPLGSLENGYARAIEVIANLIHSFPREDVQMTAQATNYYIEHLRHRGREVIDLRGVLSGNTNGARYGIVPGGLSQVEHLAHHWTGDSFSRAWYAARLGDGDISDGPIPATLTQAQERKVIDFYHEYHQSAHGWPGIAYGTLIFPSGRIYVIWDIGTWTYHAFDTNRVSYAICNPIANWAEPTRTQLVSTNHVWDVLCNYTPEIPADHTMLYGHKEFAYRENSSLPGYDERNSTSCPGTMLQHVERFRATNAFTVEHHPPAVGKHGDPDAMYFPETQHWLVHGFRGYWETNGGLGTFGYPRSEEYEDERGVTVQMFQRARMEWQPEIAGNPYGVVLGLLGDELIDLDDLALAYPEAFAPQAD